MSETATTSTGADWPALEDGFWVWDRMHYPAAITPMTASIDGPAFEQGFTRAANELSLPIAGVRVRFFHHYWYFSVVPFEGDFGRRMQAMGEAMGRRQARAGEIYEQELRPEVDRANAMLRMFPYQATPDAELARFLREAAELRARVWELHFLATQPAVAAAGWFLNLYEERFGLSPERHDLALLQGFPNATMQFAGALRALAVHARANSVLANTLGTTSPAEARRALASSVDGREFLRAIDAFLEQYGWQSGSTDLSTPSWLEDQRPLFRMLQLALKGAVQDPADAQARAAREREEAEAALLAGLAPEELTQFRGALAAAQHCLPVLEDHARVIDEMNTTLMRLPVVEAGRRLAQADVIDDPHDVFFLTVGETADALAAPAALRELAQERHSDFQRWSEASPPPVRGTPPRETPPDPTMTRFFGFGVPPSEDPYVLTGRPASRGSVTGTARVLHTLDESDRLHPGEILVCATTSPAWTPLFGTIAGLVTDTGGELSHAAMVAREYGIPCIVGTREATHVIADGDEITIDGFGGTVRLARPRA